MTRPSSPLVEWLEAANSTTSPIENTTRTEVKIDDFYVVVGFEVNNPEAFVDEIHDLSKDPGHAFFYLVKNGIVMLSFSFGPDGVGKVGWFDSGDRVSPNNYDIGALFKDGMKNARPGTPDYKITELVKAFKINLSLKQGRDLARETEQARADVKSGKQKYTLYANDTCAETARDILKKANIETPSGSGPVKHGGIAPVAIAYVVNPYMWHYNFKSAKYREAEYQPTGVSIWRPPIGKVDPIFGAI